jgi:hypothetical protein
MKVLGAESCQQKSAHTEEQFVAPALIPTAPPSSDGDDDWDPRFYLPTLLAVVAVNAGSLWWLTSHAS